MLALQINAQGNTKQNSDQASSPVVISKDVVVPGVNVEHLALLPTRPNTASELRIAVGTFETYRFDQKPPVDMQLVLKDPKTGADLVYFLAANTTLNGQSLPCPSRVIGETRFCTSFPASVVAGKTMLAVLYWALPETPSYHGTDTIISF